MPHADLPVGRIAVIPGAEIRESASRSSGPGGQHVNKTSTRVTLRWRPETSRALTPAQRARVASRLAQRLTTTGDLIVHAQAFRSRSRNRELARERLAELVRLALERRRPRLETKPSRASKERALAGKRRRAALKRSRRRPGAED